MQRLELKHAGGATSIRLAPDLLDQPGAWNDVVRATTLIVTDRTVATLHLDRLRSSLKAHAPEVLVLEPGETAKTAQTWLRILETLAAIGAQRDATVVALGGGVIGDLAGFAAASYMRGIRVVQVPTTLLAQVDAAVGGKTGFNLEAGKNLVGAFHQPHAVMVDVGALETLESRDFIAGMAEVIKYGAIRDAEFLAWLEANVDGLLDRRPEPLQEAVRRSIAHKIALVEADEREAGQRALLNFGHTFGHALETCTGYIRYRHGEAVAIGMHLAGRLSAGKGWIENNDAERLSRLIAAFGLPLDRPTEIDPETLIERMRLDKKNLAGRFRLIVLEALGRARVRDDIEPQDLLETLNS
ncbi:MAG: 3-dehydroquinate synthase [Wenzhouxiangellaceae bacterium]